MVLDCINEQIQGILAGLEVPVATYGDIDTCSVLYNLARKTEWSMEETKNIDFLSRKLDIDSAIYMGYNGKGRKLNNIKPICAGWLELLLAILLKSAFTDQMNRSAQNRLKRFNVLFKACDLVTPVWISSDSVLGAQMERVWSGLLKEMPVLDASDVEITPMPVANKYQKLKEISLTVLFYEGPIARAYLATIKSLGFKPRKIIQMVAARDVATNKEVGRWMPKLIRESFAANIQRSKMHFWPKNLLKTHPEKIERIFENLQCAFGFPQEIVSEAYALLPLAGYSDSVEPLLTEGFKDKALIQCLSDEPEGTILYTGGGIVPKAVLLNEHLQFMHIHPGYLPDIRGADCSLWSTLIAGRFSASCFYMAPGIDSGNIIKSCWLPNISFSHEIRNDEPAVAYRIIYCFLDPWVRAFVLRDVIKNNQRFDAIDSKPQNDEDGEMFHYMHDRIRKVVFSKSICLSE